MALDEHFDDFIRRDWETGADGTVRFAMVGLGWWTRDYAVPATQQSEYGVVDMRVIRAAVESARTGERVTL
ncbi:hypothetical protein [Halomicrobium katesii]|uniref:hypothetical protein n=1 Tax=Halomicrobium katesii TaxID=437163 RepID=UPI0003610171|nr:hypothetical protein [Halomicrobium katesii]